MKRFIPYLLLTVCAAFGKMGAQAQLPAPPAEWTLAQCIAYARQNNLQVATARLEAENSGQDLLLSRAARYPNLIAATTQTLGNGNPVNATDGNFLSNYSLVSALPLYNGGALRNDVRQKETLEKEVEAGVQTVELNITLQITQAYLQILLAKESGAYFTHLVQTAAEQVKLAAEKFAAGSLARKDVAQLEAQAAADQLNEVNAANAERQALFNLKALLQLPAARPFAIAVPDTVATTGDLPPLEAVETAALDQRPEISSGRLALEAAHYGLLEAEAGRRPLLTLNSNITSGFNNTLTQKGYSQQLDNNLYERTGLTLSFPLFNNRTVKTAVAKAAIAEEETNVALKTAETTLSQQVEQAYINCGNASAQEAAAQKQVQAAEETYRIASAQLKLGGITATDFLVQKNSYVQAVQDFLQAKYNRLIAYAVYRFYNGEDINL